MGADAANDEQGALKALLRELSKRMTKLKKENQQRRVEQTIEELHEADQKDRAKKCWALAFSVAKTQPGRKYKRFDAVRVMAAATADWTERCKQEGHAGGFEGTVIDWEEECRHIIAADHAQADPGYHVKPTATDLGLAETLHTRMAIWANKHKAGKFTVPGGIPNELYRTIMRPTWCLKSWAKPGVGHKKAEMPPIIRKTVILLLAKIIATRLTPLVWHLATAFTVPKDATESGTKAERLVAALDVWGRAFYRAIIDGPVYGMPNGDPLDHDRVIQDSLHGCRHPQPPSWACDWQFGCIPTRRREEAGIVQNIMTRSIVEAGYFVITTFHDGANAFYSVKLDAADEDTQPPFTPTMAEHAFMRQRIRYATMSLASGTAEEVRLLLGSGVIPGDHAGPKSFNRIMARPGTWAAIRYKRDEQYRDLPQLKCHLFPDQKLMATFSGFVDDLASKAIGRTAPQAIAAKSLSDQHIRQEMLSIGVHMNQHKEFNVVAGPRQAGVRAIIDAIPRVTEDARYLGFRSTPDQGCHIEVEHRLIAAKRAWYALRPFFISTAHLSIETMVYRATVYNTCLSGMEVAVGARTALSPNDLLPLQRLINRNLKTLMMGAATTKVEMADEEGKTYIRYHAMTADQMMKACGIVPLFLELRVRRLLWFWSMMRYPQHHELALSALLGHVANQPSHLASDGGINPAAAHDDWLRQLVMDIATLEVLDDAAELIETNTLPDGRLNIVALTAVNLEDLLSIDVTMLRHRCFAVAVPPPGLVLFNEEPPEDDPGGSFVCGLLCSDGSVCGVAFATAVGLAAHQRMTQGGTHGSHCLLCRWVRWPVCPLCRSSFRSVWVARQHVRHSLFRGYCFCDRSWTSSKVCVEGVREGCPDPECEYYGV